MQDKKPTDIVSMASCTACGRLVIYEKGNHHPWCLHCMWDEFDWYHGYRDIPREEAEYIKEMEER